MTTALHLPDSTSVLDFLRAWGFPAFVETVAAPTPPFTPETAAQLAARAGVPTPKYVSFQSSAWGERQQLILRKSLAIMPIALTDDPWADATVATQRFVYRNFQVVVERALGKAARSQLADIVREAVLNVSSHPSATLAYTSAHFRPRAAESLEEVMAGPGDLEFQFAVWDDGTPIADTLRDTLGRTGSITSDRYGEEDVTFQVTIERHPGGAERVRLTDSTPLDQTHPVFAEDHLLTCAAFMLGVSSDPTRSIHTTRPTTARPNAGGVGLAIIRQAALDSRRGRLEYRSGHLRLSVTAGESRSVYDCQVRLVPQAGWAVQGNLLTVTIPIAGTSQ
jgi:hypothetical protein